MRGFFAEVFAPFSLGIALGVFFGFITGVTVGIGRDMNVYKKCRYYDQTIERCVQELGWEKK